MDKNYAISRQETAGRQEQQQAASREHNLAAILVFTTATFLVLHTPRSAATTAIMVLNVEPVVRCVDSLYEAFTIRAQLHCEAKDRALEYNKPWRHLINSLGELLLVKYSLRKYQYDLTSLLKCTKKKSNTHVSSTGNKCNSCLFDTSITLFSQIEIRSHLKPVGIDPSPC